MDPAKPTPVERFSVEVVVYDNTGQKALINVAFTTDSSAVVIGELVKASVRAGVLMDGLHG